MPVPAVVPQELATSKDRLKQFEKTKMCKFYSLGQCSRGSACRYAHDSAEINPLPDLVCTKLCPMLVSLGSCVQPGCMYAHHREELRGTSIYHKTKICRFAQTGHCTLGSKCNFAHSDLEIRQAQESELMWPFQAQESEYSINALLPQDLVMELQPQTDRGVCLDSDSDLGPPPGLPAPSQVPSAGGLGIFSDGRSSFSFAGSLSSACSLKGHLSYEPAYVPLLDDDSCSAEFQGAAWSLKNSLVIDQSNHAWQVTRAPWDAQLPSAIRAVRTSQSTLCTLGECDGSEREILSTAKVTSGLS